MRNIKRGTSLFCAFMFLLSFSASDILNRKYANAAENANTETYENKDSEKQIKEMLTLGKDQNEKNDDLINSDEEVSLLVELNDDASAFNEENSENALNKEESIKESQKSIIKKVEDITQNTVKKSFGYLVNGFSINGKISDAKKIKDISGVKSVNIDRGSKTNMTSAKTIEQADKVLSDYGFDGSGTVVAVIDTGIDPHNNNFQDIKGTNLKISKEAANNFTNTLGHGMYINDKIPYAYNYAAENNNVYSEDQFHGMHVSGIIAANGGQDKSSGIVGVASNAQVLALRASDSEGGFHDEDVIQAIEDAVKLGADIINMSIGSNRIKSCGSEDLLKKAIDNATKKGVICVKAVGNSQDSASTDLDKEPTNKFNLKDNGTACSVSENCITVGSLENTKITVIKDNQKVQYDNDMAGKISDFSSFGPTEDLELAPEITAPGGKIYSTINNNMYGCFSGTSMAAPNVSGGEALIIQSLKDRKINLNGEELVRFLKNTIMNTAEPVMESSSNPYSPRRQGSGEMKLLNAVKNNVIAEDNRGKASLCLKNIGDKTPFTINLKNYGNKDASYKISSSGLYTETTTSDQHISEVKINGASVSFDKDTITLKQGASATICGTLNVSGLEKQNYVEGYVSLKSLDETNPDLSMPILGFYGNFDKEKIIDSPCTNADSLTKVTGLGEPAPNYKFNYYGAADSKSSDVNENNVSFSPGLSADENNTGKDDKSLDGYKDTVSANAYFLRSAKEYTLEVLDSNKNDLTNEVTYNNTVKDTVYNSDDMGSINDLLYNYTWDGKKYNDKAGKYELQPDGQYYIRMTAKGYVDDSIVQTIDLPVKLDTLGPEVKIISAEYNNGGYDIKWTASDNNSGLSTEAVGGIYGDKNSNEKITNITENNGVFSGSFKCNKVDNGVITISVMDNAQNMTTASSNIFDKSDSVFFWNFNDNQTVEKSNYIIGGDIAEIIKKVTINGKEASVNTDEQGEHTFLGQATLSYGNNPVTVIFYDEDGNAVKSVTKNVILDNNKPIIKSIEPINSNISNYYVTTDDSIDLKVNVSDDNKVKGLIYNNATYHQSDIEECSNGVLSFECKLKDGFNNVYLNVYDNLNNLNQEVIKILKVSDKEALNAGFCNIEEERNIYKSQCQDNLFNVKCYVTKPNLSVYINDMPASLGTDSLYSKDILLTTGENVINLKVKDSTGKVVADKTNKIIYNDKPFQINIDNLSQADSNGTINTDKSKYTINGSITGSIYDYSLSINDKQILRTDNGSVTSDNNNLNRNFEYTVDLKSGENIIKVTAKDDYNGQTDKFIKINCTDPNANTADSNSFIIFALLLFITGGFMINRKRKLTFWSCNR